VEAEELRDFLTQRNVRFEEHEIQSGTSFKCSTGEIFNHYPKRGKVVVQGRNSQLGQAVKAWADSGFVPAETGAPSAGAPPAIGLNKTVFVVYGHDLDARKDLELLLRRMGMEPIVLANLTPGGDTIIEKLERYLGQTSNVGFACVLLTPDDEGYAKGEPDARRYRARQNVVLELGMVLARLGRKHVAILRKESVEEPSDIAGLIWIPFTERVGEVVTVLYRTLQEAGYDPDSRALGS
jgi:predicted nucleotide-binding protein